MNHTAIVLRFPPLTLAPPRRPTSIRWITPTTESDYPWTGRK